MANIADIIKRKMKEAAKESGASLIVSDDSDGADEALTDAVQDVIDAIKDDDAEKAANALKAAVKIAHEECGSDADEE